MELYLLKSAACLAISFVFYKVFLEKTSLHVWKRIYLLATLVASFIIPLLTFTIYVEPYPVVTDIVNMPLTSSEILVVEQEARFNWIACMWFVYGLGATIFGLRFLFHLFKISEKIYRNPKQKQDRITNVLVPQNITPHTFLNYIFFNKTKFETGGIPKEVLLHEQTHAKQNHSIDILGIEILQVIFWFNPLLYFMKRAIKLNHEFLADQEVLKQGVALTKYQNILLAFSSNAPTPQLAHSIHYSSIKKRFTVMKTHTSKSIASIKMLLIVPLLAVLVYGFSTTQEIEIENNTNTLEQSSLQPEERLTARSISIEILEDQRFLVEGIKITKQHLYSTLGSLHADITKQQRDSIINIHVSSKGAIAYEDLVYIQKIATTYGYHRIVTPNEEIIRSKDNIPAAPEAVKKLHENYAAEFLIGTEKNGYKTFVLQIEVNQLLLNGRSVTVNKLTKSIDALTKDWEETDYNSATPSILIASVSEDFLVKADKEFKKTHYSKANEGLSLFRYAPPPAPVKNSNKQKGPNNDTQSSSNYIFNAGSVNAKPIGSGSIPVSTNNKFKGLSQKKLPKYEPNLRYYYQGKLVSLTEVRNLLKRNEDLRINVNKKTNTAIVTIVKRTPPPPPPSKSLGDVTQKYDYSVVIYVNGRDIYVHGKKTSLKSFAKTLDRHTQDWPDKAYKLYGLSVQLDGISKGFADQINREYRKTKLARMSSSKNPYIIGPEDVPPPPSPKVLKREKSQLPPPPPPPSKLDHILAMAKKGATFYLEGTAITSDRAIDLVKNNQNLNMNSQNNNGVATVHLSKNGSTVINNSLVNKAECISIQEVKKLKADTQKAGCVTINNTSHYYLKEGNSISYYNKWGNKVNEKGERL